MAAIERSLVVLAALVAGCTVGPDFRRPEAAPPAAWSAAASAAQRGRPSEAVAAPFDGKRWWAVFGDPVLDRLIDDAQAQNLDLQTAVLRIESARVQRVSAAGAALPQVAGNVVAGRNRMSENGIAGALGGGGGGSGGGGGASGGDGSSTSLASNLFQAGFDAVWELDLWGRVRRNVEAADAQIVSAEEARHDAQVSLAAEIARTYFGLRGTERQLEITDADVATQRRIAELVGSKQRAGLASEAELTAQAAQLNAVLARLPQLEQARAQARNRLGLLLALPPGAVDERLAAAAAADRPLPAQIPVGLPGDLLRRRPDIRRSEAELHTATARIGVVAAGLFPSVRLGLAAGLQSSAASTLTDWGSRFFLGGAAVSIPIFQGGQLRSQVTLADLSAREAALNYRQTVLNAYHEADGALVAYGQEQRRSLALAQQWADARQSRALAEGRWTNGLAAFIDVLDAERTAHQSELQLVQSRADAATDLVALFKSLGGGWDDGTPPVAPM